jgi:putative membrane protein insertion efficiency factor/ribonuclease P protein component
MACLTLPKTALIRKPDEYRRIYARGRRVRGDNFALVYLLTPAAGGARLGISISGVRSAVRRNRIKRIIREFFRLRRPGLNPALELVFTVRKGFQPDSPAAIAAALAPLTAGRPELAGLAAEPAPCRSGGEQGVAPAPVEPAPTMAPFPPVGLLTTWRRSTAGVATALRYSCLAGVRFYQLVISPLLPPSCRFTPSCSQYALEAISLYGVRRGGFLALKRILRCHPFSPGGFDPVK